MEASEKFLRGAAGGEGPCGELTSPSVLELYGASFTLTLNLSPG